MPIFVLDDDPTGSQTVHSCPLLLRWDRATLAAGMASGAPLLFLLTNSRSLSPQAAVARAREVCAAMRGLEPYPTVVVSRSDSTLRGHFPLEPQVIEAELGPFDRFFLVPAFLEGDRLTRHGIHGIRQPDGGFVPVGETEFARDPAFPFRSSDLRDYLAEKTGGAVTLASVCHLSRSELREPNLLARLVALPRGSWVTADAEEQADLDALAGVIRALADQGYRSLLRCAASLLTSLAQLPTQPLPPTEMHRLCGPGPGLVLVGSWVERTTEQLNELLTEPGLAPLELRVSDLLADPEAETERLRQAIAAAHRRGLTAVVATSRERISLADPSADLALGQRIARALGDLVQACGPDLGFIVAKGGVTANTLLAESLGVARVDLQGQIAPGVNLVRLPADHGRWPGLPVVTFPGNVGDRRTLAAVLARLRPGGGVFPT